MNEQYEEELETLKDKMLKAEKFAERVPCFSKEILSGKITGEEEWIKFGNYYKNLHCAWGINRGLYEQGTSRSLTNYRGKNYKEHLFNIYINTLTVYDSHEKYGLNEIKDKIDLLLIKYANQNNKDRMKSKHDVENALLLEVMLLAVLGGSFIPESDFRNSQAINFKLDINGENVQQGNSELMMFGFEEIIAHVSKYVTLKMGDLIYTGTPAGVGAVKIGDHLEGYLEDEKLLDFLIK